MGVVPQGGGGDRHLVTIPQGVVGDRLPWGGERHGGRRVVGYHPRCWLLFRRGIALFLGNRHLLLFVGGVASVGEAVWGAVCMGQGGGGRCAVLRRAAVHRVGRSMRLPFRYRGVFKRSDEAEEPALPRQQSNGFSRQPSVCPGRCPCVANRRPPDYVTSQEGGSATRPQQSAAPTQRCDVPPTGPSLRGQSSGRSSDLKAVPLAALGPPLPRRSTTFTSCPFRMGADRGCSPSPAQGCIRREGTSEVAPEAVRQGLSPPCRG